MDLLDPFRTDKLVKEAAQAYRSWWHRLGTNFAQARDQDPLSTKRQVASRAAYQELALQLLAPAHREGLQRWIATLTIERVTLEDWAELETSRRTPIHFVHALDKQHWSVRGLVLEASLAKPKARRALAADALANVAQEGSSNALWCMARRHEAARQLGLGSLNELEVPLDKAFSAQEAASLVLGETDSLFAEALGWAGPWQEVLNAASATDALEGWPSQLTVRSLTEMIGSRELFLGLGLDVGPLKPPRTGASFARALARLGAAFFRSAIQSRTPLFAMVQRPFDPRAASYGALFSSLLVSRPFLRKHLGLGQETARHHARSFAQSLLLTLRLQACQAALAASGEPQLARQLHASLASRALGSSMPEDLAGLLPRYSPLAASRLVGALHAAEHHEMLLDRFDEDWFDNPRAHEYLRETELRGPLVLDAPGFARALKALVRLLGEPFA